MMTPDRSALSCGSFAAQRERTFTRPAKELKRSSNARTEAQHTYDRIH